MKKKLSFIFATVFALSGFAACEKDDPTVAHSAKNKQNFYK